MLCKCGFKLLTKKIGYYGHKLCILKRKTSCSLYPTCLLAISNLNRLVFVQNENFVYKFIIFKFEAD